MARCSAGRRRQVEFIFCTAGYGNLSTTPDHAGGEGNRTANAGLGLGALSARG